MRRQIKNWIYCIILPIIVAGISTVGFFFTFSHSWILAGISIAPLIFFSGAIGYLISSLVRSVFTWEKADD